MPTLDELGERKLVEAISALLEGDALVGPGDDAAVIALGERCLVASTDLVSFSRHMPEGMSYRDFGWMAVAVNLSDIASMGAEPIAFLAALAMPGDLPEASLMEIVEGMQECASAHATPIVGGDTKVGEGLVAGTALGLVSQEELLLRSGASPHDLVAVTGRLGEAAAGFYSIEKGVDLPSAREALFRPRPRVKEGRMLAESGAISACMDLSDGLAAAVSQISQASGTGMQILWEALPLGPNVERMAEEGVSMEELALNFGGEYELLFTIRPEKLGNAHALDVDFTIIGRVLAGDENVLIKDNSIINLDDQGYEHFRR